MRLRLLLAPARPFAKQQVLERCDDGATALDCVLEKTKKAVLAEKETRQKAKLNPEPLLLKKAGPAFFNDSPLDLKKQRRQGAGTSPARCVQRLKAGSDRR